MYSTLCMLTYLEEFRLDASVRHTLDEQVVINDPTNGTACIIAPGPVISAAILTVGDLIPSLLHCIVLFACSGCIRMFRLHTHVQVA